MTGSAIAGERPVRDWMTPMPHAVTVDHSVSDALARMHVLGVHHMPVLSGDEVGGVLAERELSSIVEYGQADPAALAVGDVMARDSCLVVQGDAPLIAVVQDMADRGVDCCVVMEQGELAGIVTARDTMRLLVGALFDSGRHCVPGLRPSDVRERILSEHNVLRSIYAKTEECARRVLDGDATAEAPLRERCRELYGTLLRHIELENAILAPALHETDAFGPVRAEELLREHRRQREVLLDSMDSSDTRSETELARSVCSLIAELAVDMAHEERALLNPDLLKDDVMSIEGQSG
jgi:CBS domain-containing protein